jgi:eukaryotic-like serine/threonine-protein kinase
VQAHVETCDVCREVVSLLGPEARAETLPASGAPPADAVALPALRQRIGRYEAEGLLGTGGMGVVLVAHDRELGRRVAIKLLRADDPTRDGLRSRLIREAKAMAALSHPNVVTIYDVGEDGGEIYLAMELVRGRTLRQWLCDAPRSWREVLPIFVQAGRGLAAAHEIGIIHRDFKPENVFIGDDGRVRVGDFGLARSAGSVERVPDDLAVGRDETRTGAVLGTLRYMSPEQIEGLRADARTDQFSFCVSLYEALFGVRPFNETTVAGLRAAFRERREATLPRQRKAPAWLARLVMRGLRIDPAARFPSMAALLRALTVERAIRGRRLVLGSAAGGLVASVVIAFAIGQAAPRGEPRPCQGGHETLARAFGPEAHEGLRAVFASSPQPYVRALGERVTARLDEITAEWLEVHTDACEATVVRGEQSPELMDLRMACLGQRLRDVTALVRELGSAPPEELQRAMQAVQSLEPVATCSDVERLRSRLAPPPDPETAAAVAAVRARILEARLATEMGAYPRALGVAEEAVAEADRVGYPPALGEAHYQLAGVLSALGRGAQATAEYHKAAAIGDATRHDELAAEARTELVFSLGYKEGKREEAELMVPYAEAAIARLGGSPRLTARLLSNRSSALSLAQQHAAALPLTQEALAVLERAPRPDELMVATLHNRLGTDLKELGRYAESLAAYDRAVAIRERLLGPDHPTVALVLGNRGGTLRYLGRYDEALADLERARAIRETVLGPDHPEVAASLTNLANLHAVLGRTEEAYRLRRRALEIAGRSLPADHPFAVTMRRVFVDGLLGVDKVSEAVSFCDRWVPIELEKRPGTRMTGNLVLNCAVAHLRARHERTAWELFRKADPLVSTPQPDENAIPLFVSFAQELVARGRTRDALQLLERAYAARKAVLGQDHPQTASLEALVGAVRRRASR